MKTDNTLWSFGYNQKGVLGQNQNGPTSRHSSTVQIPGTTWRSVSC